MSSWSRSGIGAARSIWVLISRPMKSRSWRPSEGFCWSRRVCMDVLPVFPSPRHSGGSRGFLEDLIDAARYRLGAFSGHLVSKRRQLLALFAQRLELLVRMRRPQLADIRWRLGRRDLLREIENGLDVGPSHFDHLEINFDHLEIKGADVFQR